MVTIKNSEIYSADPNYRPPVMAALVDILSKEINSRLGLKLRKIVREVEQHAEDVKAEHKRLIDLHTTVEGVNGEEKRTVNREKLSPDYAELMHIEFEIEGVPFDAVRNLSLAGTTWLSSIIETDE